jgi:hypothetical protein
MAPITWTTDDQLAFLSDRLDSYREFQKTNKFGPFWDQLFLDWFEEYPEADGLFPGRATDALTDEEKDLLTKSIRDRRVVRSTSAYFVRLLN